MCRSKSACLGLRTLLLSGCENVDDSVLKEVAEKLLELRVLMIECVAIPPATLLNIPLPLPPSRPTVRFCVRTLSFLRSSPPQPACRIVACAPKYPMMAFATSQTCGICSTSSAFSLSPFSRSYFAVLRICGPRIAACDNVLRSATTALWTLWSFPHRGLWKLT